MLRVLYLSQSKNKNSSNERLTSPPTAVSITLSTSVDEMHCSTFPPHVGKCYSFYIVTPLSIEVFLAILFLFAFLVQPFYAETIIKFPRDLCIYLLLLAQVLHTFRNKTKTTFFSFTFSYKLYKPFITNPQIYTDIAVVNTCFFLANIYALTCISL